MSMLRGILFAIRCLICGGFLQYSGLPQILRRVGTLKHQPTVKVSLSQGDSSSRWPFNDEDPPDLPGFPKSMEELQRKMQRDSLLQDTSNTTREDPLGFPIDEDDVAFITEAVLDVFGDGTEDEWVEKKLGSMLVDEDKGESKAPSPTNMSLQKDGQGDEGWAFDETQDEYEEFKRHVGEYDNKVPTYSPSIYKAGGSTVTFAQTPYAQYWDSLPDLEESGKMYSYNALDRLSTIKYLMNCTYNGMFGDMENHQSRHFLWIHVDQLDWMRRSGRLSSTPGSIKVDSSSWWGHVSYALTVAPLSAALECGLWPDSIPIIGCEELKQPPMARAIRAWRRVWLYQSEDIAFRAFLNLPVHDTLTEGLRRKHWAAVLESLHAVEVLHRSEFELLPWEEQKFAKGWLRTAKLLAAAAAPSDLDGMLLSLGAGYLPERLLRETSNGMEHVPYSASLPEGEGGQGEGDDDEVTRRKTRRFIRSLHWLGSLPDPAWGIALWAWKRACASYPARRAAPRTLHRWAHGGPVPRAWASVHALLCTMVPDLNYRKLTPPFGVDPAEDVEYDPAYQTPENDGHGFEVDENELLNALQRPWYDGPRPDLESTSSKVGGQGGWEDEDEDGLFPPGVDPSNLSDKAYQQIEDEILEDFRMASNRKGGWLCMQG
ncbi:unnamed protein product [Choristocarpus tenellus]